MKKRFILPVVLLILGVFLITWMEYREYESYRGTIPDQSEAIIKIRIDRLVRKSIQETILHPSDWFIKRDSARISIDERKGSGISIPANLFLFKLKGYDQAWFAKLKISDFEKARIYLGNKFIRGDVDTLYFYDDTRWELLLGEEELLVCFNMDSEDHLRQLIRNKFKFSFENDFQNWMSNVKEFNEDIAIIDQNGSVSLDSKGKELILEGNFDNSFITDNPLISILDIRLDESVQKDLDEFRFGAYLEGLTQIRDTVVNFEYDDNFNRVQVKSIVEKLVPGMIIIFPSEPNEMEGILIENFGLEIKSSDKDQRLYSNLDSVSRDIPFPDNDWEVRINLKGMKNYFTDEDSTNLMTRIEKIHFTGNSRNDSWEVTGKIEFDWSILNLLR